MLGVLGSPLGIKNGLGHGQGFTYTYTAERLQDMNRGRAVSG